MAGEKGLDYYLNNPDEMPDDISALEAEMNSEAVPTEPELAVEESVSADAEVKTEVAEEKQEAEEPALIETKQGKPAIPYAVLVGERERRHAAEQAVESLRKELDLLSAKVDQSAANHEAVVPAEASTLSEDSIEAMAQEFPEIGKVLKALSEKTRSLDEQLAKVAEAENARIDKEQKRAFDEVQEAIDANPTLRYWQTENPQLWGEAVKLDEMIKANPMSQSQTLSERFEKVVASIEAIYGKAELPDAYKPPKAPDTSIEQVAAKAKAAVEKVGSFKPKTLSDMPGGATPPTTERERIENMAPHELQRLMESMDADQMAAFIAKAV